MHRTDQAYEDSYAAKLFALEFVNHFFGLLWIAFAKPFVGPSVLVALVPGLVVVDPPRCMFDNCMWELVGIAASAHASASRLYAFRSRPPRHFSRRLLAHTPDGAAVYSNVRQGYLPEGRVGGAVARGQVNCGTRAICKRRLSHAFR